MLSDLVLGETLIEGKDNITRVQVTRAQPIEWGNDRR